MLQPSACDSAGTSSSSVSAPGGWARSSARRDHDLQRDRRVSSCRGGSHRIPDRLARFAQEARAAFLLNHPNIVTIHEIGQASGLRTIVMEFVTGRRCGGSSRTGRCPRTGAGLSQSSSPTASAKPTRGIVHRDLKPENVMVTKDSFVKILDFGLAKLRADEPAEANKAPAGRSGDRNRRRPPVPGLIFGTVGLHVARAGPRRAGRSPVRPVCAGGHSVRAGHGTQGRSPGLRGANPRRGHRARPRADREPESRFPCASPAGPSSAGLEKEKESRYASTLDLARELRSVREHISETRGPVSDVTPDPARRWRVPECLFARCRPRLFSRVLVPCA